MSARQIHALDVLERDADGDELRHALTPHEPTSPDEAACVECRGIATVPHPLARVRPQYRDVVLVEQCRGLTLCRRERCLTNHLERHRRQRAEEDERAAEKERATRRGRSAA